MTGNARGIFTYHSIWRGVAPIMRAASITVSGRPRRLVPLHHDPELVALNSFGLYPAQGAHTDGIVRDMQIDVLLQPHLERVGVIVGIAANRHQPAFHTLRRRRSSGTDVPRLAPLLENVPKLRALGAVSQIDFKAALFRPA